MLWEPRKLVFVDESATYLNMQRDYAWSAIGVPAYVQSDKRLGKQQSLLASLSLEGVTSSLLIEGSVDTDTFLFYLEHHLLPTLVAGQRVIMDSCPIHLSDRVNDLIVAKGAQLELLPTYSPDLSPIEQAFSKIKTILKSLAAQTPEALSMAVKQAIDSITLKDIIGWFRDCGYEAHYL